MLGCIVGRKVVGAIVGNKEGTNVGADVMKVLLISTPNPNSSITLINASVELVEDGVFVVSIIKSISTSIV